MYFACSYTSKLQENSVGVDVQNVAVDLHRLDITHLCDELVKMALSKGGAGGAGKRLALAALPGGTSSD